MTQMYTAHFLPDSKIDQTCWFTSWQLKQITCAPTCFGLSLVKCTHFWWGKYKAYGAHTHSVCMHTKMIYTTCKVLQRVRIDLFFFGELVFDFTHQNGIIKRKHAPQFLHYRYKITLASTNDTLKKLIGAHKHISYVQDCLKMSCRRAALTSYATHFLAVFSLSLFIFKQYIL